MAQVNQDFEAVFERIVAWMLDNPDACRELEDRLVTFKTDFGDIKIVSDRPMDDQPLAVCKLNAPR